jgi:hypothetical protein
LMEYHKVDFGEDGLDGKVSYVKVYWYGSSFVIMTIHLW